MKITKARLRQIIMEELQSEAFGQGEDCPPGEECPEEELEERATMKTVEPPRGRRPEPSRRAKEETPAERKAAEKRIAKLDAEAEAEAAKKKEEEEKKGKKGDLEELKRLIARELKNLL